MEAQRVRLETYLPFSAWFCGGKTHCRKIIKQDKTMYGETAFNYLRQTLFILLSPYHS